VKNVAGEGNFLFGSFRLCIVFCIIWNNMRFRIISRKSYKCILENVKCMVVTLKQWLLADFLSVSIIFLSKVQITHLSAVADGDIVT
jgi:hypothetical protein